MIKRYLEQTFSIEYRTLGLFRIGVGLLLICDLLSRILYGLDLISPAGVIPLDQATEVLQGKSLLSAYLLSDNYIYFISLLGLTTVSYLLYLVGYKTKVFGTISLVLLFSLQNRNPFVLHGGDILLRIFLFTSLLLPIKSFSWDSKGKTVQGSYSSAATVFLFLQIGLMYFFSALHKTGPDWLQTGDAVSYALKVDWISNSWGQSLSNYPSFLKPFTYATLLFEVMILPLTFINFKRVAIRWILFISIFAFHLGTFITMDIGTYPFVGMLASLVFYPSADGKIDSSFGFDPKNLIAAIATILAVLCNILFLNSNDMEVIKRGMMNIGIYQKWAMFSPSPARTNVQIKVTLTNELNLATQTADIIEIGDIRKSYHSHHWQKLLMSAVRPGSEKLLRSYSNFLCKENPRTYISVELLDRDTLAATEASFNKTMLLASECGSLKR